MAEPELVVACAPLPKGAMHEVAVFSDGHWLHVDPPAFYRSPDWQPFTTVSFEAAPQVVAVLRKVADALEASIGLTDGLELEAARQAMEEARAAFEEKLKKS